MEKLIYPQDCTLLPFQADCIHKMLAFLRNCGGCYNACEMGLGKSVQAIVAMNTILRYELLPKILIVCPAVMRLVWRAESQKWLTSLHPSVQVLTSSKQLKQKPLWHAVTIISYDLAATEEFKKWAEPSYDMLICDEAHYLKSPKAKRTKAILKHIWPRAVFKICLSGTPFTNNVIDGYTLFNKLAPYDFPDFWSFANTYSHRKNNGFGITWEGLKNADKLRTIINNNFFLRKTKAQVLPDLPPKVYQKITLDKSYAHKLTKEQEAEYEKYYQDLKRLLAGKDFKRIPPPPVSIMTVRKEQGLKKVKPIIEFVELLVGQGIPVVLFGIFRDVLTELEEAFKKYKPAVIHGDVSAKKRQEEIERFQAGDTDLFIGQLTAAGVGITLTRASDVVLAELSYSPAEISQAVDRTHRISQKNSVTVHYFAVENSVDEKIIDIVMDKAKIFSEILKEHT
jgi:SWI/SNF-related matrix-associated actin-dependent regulator 1 of chromatin subfamily A